MIVVDRKRNFFNRNLSKIKAAIQWKKFEEKPLKESRGIKEKKYTKTDSENFRERTSTTFFSGNSASSFSWRENHFYFTNFVSLCAISKGD